MISLKNTDSQVLTWHLMTKYNFDTATALATGTLAPSTSTSVPSPTGTTVSVVWSFGNLPAAAGIVGDGGASVFHNDPNGSWAQTL